MITDTPDAHCTLQAVVDCDGPVKRLVDLAAGQRLNERGFVDLRVAELPEGTLALRVSAVLPDADRTSPTTREDSCTPKQVEALREIYKGTYSGAWTGSRARTLDKLIDIGRDGTRRSVVAVAADGTVVLTPVGAAILRAVQP